NGRTKGLARVLCTDHTLLACLCQVHVFADGHKLHFRSNDALACIVHLADVGACFGTARLADMLKTQVGGLYVALALLAVAGTYSSQQFSIAALFNPALADSRQTGTQIHLIIG